MLKTKQNKKNKPVTFCCRSEENKTEWYGPLNSNNLVWKMVEKSYDSLAGSGAATLQLQKVCLDIIQ